MAIIFAGLSLLNFLSPVSKTGFMHYKYLIDAVIAFSFFLMIYRPLYLRWFNKPALIVTEDGLYDCVNSIDYRWIDIEAIYEENSYLRIRLFNPQEYFIKIKNPIGRAIREFYYKPGKKGSHFFINIDIVDADQDDLMEVINEYCTNALPHKMPNSTI